MKKHNSIGHICCLICIFVWGTTFISTKILLNDFKPVEILFFRTLLAVIALNLIYPKRLKNTTLKQELHFAAAGLCGVTLYFLLENIALTYTQASNASVIVSIAPIFTAILSFFFIKQEKLNIQFFIGFIAAIAGICLISFSGSTELKLNPKGDLLAMGAALSWAFYSIFIKKISAWGYHTIQTTRRIFMYGILFMIPFMIAMNFRLDLKRFQNPIYSANILFLGLGASAACFVIWNYAIKLLGTLKSSVYIYLVPAVTVVTSILIIHEKITILSTIGTLLAIFGLLISETKFSLHKKAQP